MSQSRSSKPKQGRNQKNNSINFFREGRVRTQSNPPPPHGYAQPKLHLNSLLKLKLHVKFNVLKATVKNYINKTSQHIIKSTANIAFC